MPAKQMRALAALANVDPRTVRKELDTPGSVKGKAGERIRAALAQESEPEAGEK